MKTALAALAAVPLVAASPLARRDTPGVSTVLYDISVIRSDTLNLTGALYEQPIQTYIGDVLNNLTLLRTALDQGINDARAIPTVVTECEAYTVLQQVSDLTPIINGSIAATIFDLPPGQQLGGIASDTLNGLKNQTDVFSGALYNVTPSDMACNAVYAQYTIDLIFSKAIQSYADASTTTGTDGTVTTAYTLGTPVPTVNSPTCTTAATNGCSTAPGYVQSTTSKSSVAPSTSSVVSTVPATSSSAAPSSSAPAASSSAPASSSVAVVSSMPASSVPATTLTKASSSASVAVSSMPASSIPATTLTKASSSAAMSSSSSASSAPATTSKASSSAAASPSMPASSVVATTLTMASSSAPVVISSAPVKSSSAVVIPSMPVSSLPVTTLTKVSSITPIASSAPATTPKTSVPVSIPATTFQITTTSKAITTPAPTGCPATTTVYGPVTVGLPPLLTKIYYVYELGTGEKLYIPDGKIAEGEIAVAANGAIEGGVLPGIFGFSLTYGHVPTTTKCAGQATVTAPWNNRAAMPTGRLY